MELNQLEDAVKSDLVILTTLKMDILPAKHFYGTILALTVKIASVFFIIDSVIRFIFYATTFYQPPVTVSVILLTWVVAFLISCFLGVPLSRFVLFSQLIKGRFKTGALIKQKILHVSMVYCAIYTAFYALLTVFSTLGMDFHQEPLFLTIFVIVFSQFGAFIAATVITWFIAMIELDRLGLGIFWNAIGEWIQKSKRHHSGSVQ